MHYRSNPAISGFGVKSLARCSWFEGLPVWTVAGKQDFHRLKGARQVAGLNGSHREITCLALNPGESNFHRFTSCPANWRRILSSSAPETTGFCISRNHGYFLELFLPSGISDFGSQVPQKDSIVRNSQFFPWRNLATLFHGSERFSGLQQFVCPGRSLHEVRRFHIPPERAQSFILDPRGLQQDICLLRRTVEERGNILRIMIKIPQAQGSRPLPRASPPARDVQRRW